MNDADDDILQILPNPGEVGLGPERAAYCTVLFPLVALAISSVVEGYAWTAPALAGLGTVMAGNVLVFRKPRPAPVPRPQAARA